MSEAEKGLSRAKGALDNFLAEMAEKLEREGRSPEYVLAFKVNLKNVMADYALAETK